LIDLHLGSRPYGPDAPWPPLTGPCAPYQFMGALLLY